MMLVRVGCVAALCAFVGPAAAQPWPSLPDAGPRLEGAANDRAVVVAIEDYAALPDVVGAGRNGLAWDAWFRLARQGSSELITNADAFREAVLKTVEREASATPPGATFWFVFIGHGAPV